MSLSSCDEGADRFKNFLFGFGFKKIDECHSSELVYYEHEIWMIEYARGSDDAAKINVDVVEGMINTGFCSRKRESSCFS